MASAAGFLRHFAETITTAIADSDREINGLAEKLAEARAENDRLRTLAVAGGIHIGAEHTLHLMDGTASRDTGEHAA